MDEMAFIGRNMSLITVGWDAGDIWISVSDRNSEGSFVWQSGPEVGQFIDLRLFGDNSPTYYDVRPYQDWMAITTGYSRNILAMMILDRRLTLKV